MTITTHTAATAAKIHGQQLSIDDLLVDHETTFMNIVAALTPGTDFTFNSIRVSVDAAGIPTKQRAALMRSACLQGLAAPILITIAGQQTQAKVASTGTSAKGAYVSVYRRTAYQPGVK